MTGLIPSIGVYSRSRWRITRLKKPCGRLLIYVASTTNGHHHNQEDPVINGVNDSVVAHPEPIAGSPTKWSGCRWTWIVSEKGDDTLNAWLNGAVDSSNLKQCRWSEFDSVITHNQPRSIFTCSQGMLFPSSAKAASNATMSCDSSNASSISS